MNFTPVNKTVTLVAKRNSGKSVLIKYIISEYKDEFDQIYCICPTESINDFYSSSSIVDRDHIFDEWDEEWVEKLIAMMTRVNKGKTKTTAKHILIILDDLIADANLHQSPAFKKLFTRGRHLFISIIMTTQYLKAIPPLVRANSDFIFLGQMNRQSVEIMVEEFHGNEISKKDFIDIYKNAIKNYGFFVINQSSVDCVNKIYGSIHTPKEYV
jgi:hypothetical protein